MFLVFPFLVRRLARKRRNDRDSDLDSPGLYNKVHICSVNNFPTAAGLASSAAGFACLGKCHKNTYDTVLIIVKTQQMLFHKYWISLTTSCCLDMPIHPYDMSYLLFPILPGLFLLPLICVAVYTLAQVFGVEGELSGIARQGSGSACRSMYGGFVQWLMGQKDDGDGSVAQQVEPETHWPELRILVLVVC